MLPFRSTITIWLSAIRCWLTALKEPIFMNIKEITAETLADWQQRGESFKLLDVRAHSEMQQGMIPQGLSQPMAAIPGDMDKYDRDETIVVYCRSGVRSYQVCAFMQEQGFSNVINLRGGIIAWNTIGQQIVMPSEVDLQACV